MSNAERKTKIPDAPAPTAVPGNLLSIVTPPSQLPSFVIPKAPIPAEMLPPGVSVAPQSGTEHRNDQSPKHTENFSPAIPLSKGEPLLPIRSPEDSQNTPSPVSDSSTTTSEADTIGDVMPGSGLMQWVKGAVGSGGLFQRVAERAKSSVDSMITTLDPQMKEYLKSGGDIYIVVASDKDVKVSAVREAFQAVFGKATIAGMAAQSSVTAEQPVGYAAAYAACKQRIAVLRSANSELNNNVPIVAVESYLNEATTDRWYEQSLVVLSQPSLGIEVHQVSQGTAVPAAAVTAARAATPADYPHGLTGFATSVGAIVAASLQVPHTQWQEATTGVSRREMLALASRALAGSYKKLLAVSAAET